MQFLSVSQRSIVAVRKRAAGAGGVAGQQQQQLQ